MQQCHACGVALAFCFPAPFPCSSARLPSCDCPPQPLSQSDPSSPGQFRHDKLVPMLLHVGLQRKSLGRLRFSTCAGAVWALSALAVLGGLAEAPTLQWERSMAAPTWRPCSTNDTPGRLYLASNHTLDNITAHEPGTAETGSPRVRARMSNKRIKARQGLRHMAVSVGDAAWSEGRPLGWARQVSGCGCGPLEEPIEGAGASKPRLHASVKRRWDDARGVWRRGLETLLVRIVELLRDPMATFPATFTLMDSGCRLQGSEAKSHAQTPGKGGMAGVRGATNTSRGSIASDVDAESNSTACAQETQAAMDIVWGMAVLRPRVNMARCVLRSLPRWNTFKLHRRMAQKLMPHWFPLSSWF